MLECRLVYEQEVDPVRFTFVNEHLLKHRPVGRIEEDQLSEIAIPSGEQETQYVGCLKVFRYRQVRRQIENGHYVMIVQGGKHMSRGQKDPLRPQIPAG